MTQDKRDPFDKPDEGIPESTVKEPTNTDDIVINAAVLVTKPQTEAKKITCD